MVREKLGSCRAPCSPRATAWREDHVAVKMQQQAVIGRGVGDDERRGPVGELFAARWRIMFPRPRRRWTPGRQRSSPPLLTPKTCDPVADTAGETAHEAGATRPPSRDLSRHVAMGPTGSFPRQVDHCIAPSHDDETQQQIADQATADEPRRRRATDCIAAARTARPINFSRLRVQRIGPTRDAR